MQAGQSNKSALVLSVPPSHAHPVDVVAVHEALPFLQRQLLIWHKLCAQAPVAVLQVLDALRGLHDLQEREAQRC